MTRSELDLSQGPSYLDQGDGTPVIGSDTNPFSPRRSVDFVSINYFPEVTGIAPYVTDVARRLAVRGWNVRVITGYPHYPQWRLLGNAEDFETVSVIDGVTVVRVRHSIPSTASLVPRSRMELEFGFRAIRSRVRRDALVVITSPPLFASTTMLLYRKLGYRRSSPMGVWVHDLYSQAVSEAASGKWATRKLVRMLEGFTLRAADNLAVVHPRFGEIIVTRLGSKPASITQLPNWNQAQPRERLPRSEAREKLGISPNEIVVVHAGNMGLKQGLDNVVDAASLISTSAGDSQRIHFYLVGNGNQYQSLRLQAKGVESITFVDSLPQEEFHQMLSAADILLVNEKSGVAEMSIPSKLTTYFSYGLPVIAAVAEDGITASEVRKSAGGIVIPAGDPGALVQAVTQIAVDNELAATLGEAGLKYSRDNLSVDAAIDRFESWLEQLAKSKRVRL